MTAPDWLAELQRDLGRLLREPLDSSTGTFRARTDRYPAGLVAEVRGADALDRLRLYHEQGWMRLFDALQASAPRVVEAMGPWAFNHLAAEHLRERPPPPHDLERAADGLCERVVATMAHRPEVVEAERADLAERRCFHAPYAAPWRPTPEALAALGEGTIAVAPSLQIARLGSDVWVWSRTREGTARRRVHPVFARLLEEVARRPFREALAATAQGLDDAGRAQLAAGLRGWIGQALAFGWWVGLRASASSATSQPT